MSEAPLRLTIDIDYLRYQLEALLAIPSPTGYTDSVVRYVCGELDRMDVHYELTRRGAIRARLPGEAMTSARAIVSHVDTLGAQVKAIKPNGRLEVVPIGHWSARFAEGARTTVFTDAGSYRGTILPLRASGHTYGDDVDTLPVGWEYVELRIDAYAMNPEDVHRLGIEVGDIVAIDPQPEFLDNGFIVSRHLDNKGGVAIMLAAIQAMVQADPPPVDIYWMFTIAEEVGHGAASILLPNIASLVAVDNGTSAPGQNSAEFGVTISMADMTGPFDYHLTRKLAALCRDNDIRFQKDVFRFYRSDSASAVEAGADVRTALVTFGVDASHGYERIHVHALRSLAELLTCYARSEVAIARDRHAMTDLTGFTTQPEEPAGQELTPDIENVDS
ncbi:MAG: osmoprotectant NAGGN system M42 family peptidase [Alphaproteobacteria bacterium]|nr:osmoprotectant NAGGN system M42 family peptidase [Alphaproteobacteria bacterium]MCB9929875.1 osmoprotectant NAGGN system M42 family peptidase [Alphaproteobacteria bacterium]